ncbi:putative zinc finger protein [Tokyovirus A1]|uniref:putative zinc finger protein n=1 Tax=Tokyovirus A1 TaxID=1826170 RepID=UPI0007A96D83|nr:putative zinc finger protein [Tokyovirus A1]BAU79977.1 putative zinc finger protein [Tokyovirus A1]
MEQYECKLCDKSFTTLSNYRQHLGTKKHQKAEKGETEPEKFSCDACRYETAIKCNYHVHMRSARHERNFKNKNPFPEGFCECCKVDVGCHSRLQRHRETREHKLAFEKFCRLSPEKLEKLQKVVLQHLLRNEVFSFETEKRCFLNRISPKKNYRDANDDVVFFSWMKSCVEHVQDIVEEKEGRCMVSWTNHKYIMSKKDFFSFVLTLACCIRSKRLELSEKEAQNGNSELCVDEKLYVGFDTASIKHKNMSTENTHHSLVHCESFWKWWFLEEKLKKDVTECARGLILSKNGETPPFADRKTLSQEKFMSFISSFSVTTKKEYSGDVLTLAFLTKIFPFVSPGASEDNSPIFYLSFINRSNKVSSSLTSAYFGLRKATPFAKRVETRISQISELEITV